MRSVFHGQFNVWSGHDQVSVIIPQFASVPLIMALIFSSSIAAPFTISANFDTAMGIALCVFLSSFLLNHAQWVHSSRPANK